MFRSDLPAPARPLARDHRRSHVPTRARSEGLPVYLETAKESNVRLYRKLGFTLIGEWDAPEVGPHFWSMLCEN